MSNVVGRAEEIYDYNTSFGTMYGIVVNGQKYGCGKVKPRAGVGDTVSFRFTEKGQYKNVDMKTFNVESGGAPAADSGPATSGSTYTPRETSDGRQNSIVRQNALSSAVAFISALVAADAVPGVKKTTAPEEKYGLLHALLVETADEFFNANIKGVSLASATEGGDSRAEQAAGKAATDGDWK
jgi:hypothetical protein